MTRRFGLPEPLEHTTPSAGSFSPSRLIRAPSVCKGSFSHHRTYWPCLLVVPALGTAAMTLEETHNQGVIDSGSWRGRCRGFEASTWQHLVRRYRGFDGYKYLPTGILAPSQYACLSAFRPISISIFQPSSICPPQHTHPSLQSLFLPIPLSLSLYPPPPSRHPDSMDRH